MTASARELRYLRQVAKLLVEVDLNLLSDERTFSESYVKLSDTQELAKKALDIGKLSRAEIIKKARSVAAGTKISSREEATCDGVERNPHHPDRIRTDMDTQGGCRSS